MICSTMPTGAIGLEGSDVVDAAAGGAAWVHALCVKPQALG
jgi:hypothetical protein